MTGVQTCALPILRFLNEPKHGFTDNPDYESPDQFFVNMGTAVAAQAATNAHQSPKDGVRFGDGNFGGGGSEGKY